MEEDLLRFTEWVAKQITIEVLEYNLSDDIWYLQSDFTDNKIHQFRTENLYRLWKDNDIAKYKIKSK